MSAGTAWRATAMVRIRALMALLLAVLAVSSASTVGSSTASAVAVDRSPDVVHVSSQMMVNPVDADTRRVPTSVDELAVSGHSNRETGHVVIVELRRPDGTVVRVTDTEVAHGTQNATLDVAGVEPGSYLLSVSDGAVTNSVSLEIVGTPTPADTPFETPTTTPRDAPPSPDDTPSETPTATPTLVPIPSPVPTLARSPGFGAAAAGAALVLTVAMLGWRRR